VRSSVRAAAGFFRPYWKFSMMNGGLRTGRAAWHPTEDTDWCGSFKPRSDAESEPDKEEF
jgi:hypothetical protein